MSGEVIPLIPIPKPRKAKASVWRDIGVAETDHVLRLSTVEETKSFLMETFRIVEDPDERYLIVLDMFYYAVQFCKENDFTSEKASCLLSIVKQTHEMATETPFGNIRETLDFFKDLILCHSVHRPPFSLGIFSPQEAHAISNYFVDTYFRHFKLYKYIFTPQVQLDLSISYTKFPRTPKDTNDDKRSSVNEDLNSAREAGEEIDSRPHEAEAEQEQDEPADAADQAPVEEEGAFDPSTESVRELKRLIRERLTMETQALQASIAAQLHQSDEAIGKVALEAADPGKKQTAGGKKKK